jgi:hypothetical protein
MVPPSMVSSPRPPSNISKVIAELPVIVSACAEPRTPKMFCRVSVPSAPVAVPVPVLPVPVMPERSMFTAPVAFW